MPDQPVDDLDRLLRIVDRDVHVEAEDQLTPGDVLHLVDERAIAVSGGDALALEERERVRSGGSDAHATLGGDTRDVAAQRAQLRCDVRGRVADRRCDLEHGLHQLGVDPRLELVARHGGEHRVDVLDEVECLAVEQHVLLLDTERVRVAASEGVVEHAAALRESAALSGDRRRVDLLHAGINASASISTSQLGSRRPETTTNDVTGRAPEKNSPCARPTPSQSSACTR